MLLQDRARILAGAELTVTYAKHGLQLVWPVLRLTVPRGQREVGDLQMDGFHWTPTQAVTAGSSYTNKQALVVIRVPNTRGPLWPGPLVSLKQPITLRQCFTHLPPTVHSSNPFTNVSSQFHVTTAPTLLNMRTSWESLKQTDGQLPPPDVVQGGSGIFKSSQKPISYRYPILFRWRYHYLSSWRLLTNGGAKVVIMANTQPFFYQREFFIGHSSG